MTRSLFCLAVPAILAAAPLLAQAQGRAAPQSTASPEALDAAPPQRPAADRLESMLWDAAVKADSASAFSTYLNRYPNGSHVEEAEAAIDAIRRSPPRVSAEAVVPSPTPVAPNPAPAVAAGAPPTVAARAVAASKATNAAPTSTEVTIARASNVGTVQGPAFLCRPVFSGDTPYEQGSDAEVAAYLQAVRLNSLTAYQSYLNAYPGGAFAGEVAELVASRQGRMSTLASLGGPGPAAARARTQVRPTDGDYPSAALRDGREGKPTAVWEIAEDGCVELCRIEKSSGSPALDAATCRMMTARGRYDPALDAQGRPIRSTDSATFAWSLPQH